jgi:hypothetical protein
VNGYAKEMSFMPQNKLEPVAENRNSTLMIAAAAAFCTYFCMYAFRKPFTAATFENQELWGLGFKTVLVISQLLGYMLSKFIGIKVIAEMPPRFRAASILGLITIAEVALVGFAFAPPVLQVLMMFLNGLPLGMVFGLVLGYLEGRKQTEALSAALCASFIVSSGVVKSIGRWLITDIGVGEFSMPMFVGLIFLLPLCLSVVLLARTPPPDQKDLELRARRTTMSREQRRQFLARYWPGLTLLVFVYMALTIVRSARDDFSVEIWRDLGVGAAPQVFAQSETLVAIAVTALNALAIWITGNLAAIRVTITMMCLAFALAATATFAQSLGVMSAMFFMVTCGIGLYVPYVAFHTTVFERLIAASRMPGNLGFLMYFADAIGYLGYSIVLVFRTRFESPASVLPSFRWILFIVSASSIVALLSAGIYFTRTLRNDEEVGNRADEELAEPKSNPN